MPDALEVLGSQADSAVDEVGQSQSNGGDSGASASASTYDDSKVVERLDGILKRFDTVDEALKSLQTRGDTKQGDSSSVVVIDSSQYDYIQGSLSVNLYLTLIVAVLLACIFGYGIWHVFSGLWEV